MSTAAGRSSDEGGGVMNGAGDWAAAPLRGGGAGAARGGGTAPPCPYGGRAMGRRRRARTGGAMGRRRGTAPPCPYGGWAKGRRVGRVLRPDGHGMALLAIAAAPTGILYKRNLHNIIKAEL
ncbi:hypothetical protein EYB53_016580 [Candidatus Chloroploca sp. M-50]|uniref:Uncharacterized protein n=1 Tax=Candidatus Chloroploca mongolica TaxID=2528176 RepID=A0ABS4DD05_9CHLR|nr:hypothetical protein [Candidatus Chloroploca mongolica]MBP1467330.1 hypothetical protein [Candidatus Chloroploca mongolica]